MPNAEGRMQNAEGGMQAFSR